MSTEVTIKNFQSLKDVSFKIEGFTVIVGKNNIGKSAIIRAIDAALTNEAGSEFIRFGEKETSVSIKRKEIEIEWTKGDSATYKVGVNGGKLEPYTKLNRAVPEPIIKAGFEQIQIEDKWVSPIIAHQFEPLFLLNKRGSVITEVLTALYDMDLISTADDLCQKDLKSQKSSLKTREKDLTELQEKLKAFKGFDAIKAEMINITALERACIDLQNEINELIKYEEEIQALEKDLAILDNLKKIEIPKSVDIEAMIAEVQWLIDKEQEIRTSSEIFRKLKSAHDVSVPSTADMEELVKTVDSLKKWDDEITQIKGEMARHQSVLNTIDLTALNALQATMETQLQEFTESKRMEEEFLSVATTAKASREELKNVTDELEKKQKEKAQIKVCPTCERPF